MNKSDEYQTPKKYIEAARLVMGSIDLDPASDEINNRRLKIQDFFSKENSALDINNKWHGNIWLNPPYSKPNLTNFTDQLLINCVARHYDCPQAIYLIPSYTSEKWYHKCLQNASAICLPDHRIEFLLEGKKQTSPRFANTFFYFGNNPAKFCQIFTQFGYVHIIAYKA